MATLGTHIPTQHISGITADNGSNVFVGSNTTNNIINRDPLQLLLPYATDASFNASGKEQDPYCLPETRVELLESIRTWTDGGDDKRHIFWLRGWAGTGKSTIARTVAREHYDRKRLVASFFFSRGGGAISHAGMFVRTIAVQLAHKSPGFRYQLQKAISEDQGIVQRVLRDQWRELVIGPLLQVEDGSLPSPLIIVVDALDECETESDIKQVLQILADTRGLDRVHLRVFVTSRPETPIRDGFSRFSDDERRDLILHDISGFVVDRDISVFLKHHLSIIRPPERVIEQLVRKASGLFIWAATTCRFVHEGKRFSEKRLAMIIESNSTAITAPEKHLNEVYITVLKHSISAGYTDEEREDLLSFLRHVLGSIVVLFSPLSSESLSKILQVTKQEIEQTLEDLYAILDIPKNQTCPLRLHHPSFRDFLLDKERCGDSNFQVDEKQAHQALTVNCIQLMFSSLKQDICGVDAPDTRVANVDETIIKQYLPPEVKYACLYWIQHLQKGGAQLYDNDQVHQFLQIHFLHWLEALGWMGKTSEGILAILSLEALIPAEKSPNLQAFVHDAKRFVLHNRSVIEQAPLQLYCSALVFAPENSIVRRQFEKDIPLWIQTKPKVQANWNAALQILEGHSDSVQSVAFSPNGKLVVSGSADKTVRLWDAVTGAVLQTLEGHSDWVNSVAFSPDGKLVVSGSSDKTVRLWNVVTGAAFQTLEGYSGWINLVAFSPDSKLVISGTYNGTIRLWNAITGAALKTLKIHLDWVDSIVFSSDAKLIVLGLHDKTLRLWGKRATLQTLKGHLGVVKSVAFSSNGKLVVSGSSDKTVRLWDVIKGATLQTLKGHSGSVNSVAFSPDGTLVVSGAEDKTVRLWDAATGELLQTLEDHSHWVNSVAFSPDSKLVVSGSSDNTVRLWDAVTGAALKTLESHSDSVTSIAFTPDGKLVVSSADDETVRLWDAVTGAALQTLEGFSASFPLVAFSLDGKLVVPGAEDNTVLLWDAAAKAALQTLEGHSDLVSSVAFSPDGKLVISGSFDETVRLWDAVTGAALQILEGHSDSVQSVAFSPDGKLVLSGSSDKTLRLWDAVTGAALQTLEGHSHSVNSVAFSPDGKLVVSGAEDNTVRLWDAITGAALQTLVGHSFGIESVAFSPDGKLVVSIAGDETVRLWNAVTGAALQTLESHSGWVNSVAFSPDGKLVHTLAVLSNWVVEGATKFLWLPPDYQATCLAVWNRVIVLGHSSGRISFLEFKEGSKLI